MFWIRIFLALVCVSIPLPLSAWDGQVTAVIDGDLLAVLHDGTQEKVRLFGVDTPDPPQEFGKEARDFTSSFILGKNAEITPVTQDRHGNTIALVSVDGVILNEQLVRKGLAWVYARSAERPEGKGWKAIETQARADKVGLWSAAEPVSPWEFRSSGGNVASTSQGAGGEPAPKAAAAGKSVEYHGDIVNRVYHAPGCPQYACQDCIAEFKSRSEAEKAGYKRCPTCGR